MEWVFGALLMILSFFVISAFSALEIAYASVRRSTVAKYVMEHGSTIASKALEALLEKDRMVVVSFILLLIFIVTLGTPWVLRGILSDHAALSNSVFVVYAVILFIFGELVIKNRGYKSSLKIALFAAPFFNWAIKVFLPFTWVLRLVYHLSGGKERVQMEEGDVLAAAQVAQQDGAIKSEETWLIRKVIKAGNKTVNQLFTPLDRCVKLPLKPTSQQAREALNEAIASSQVFICVVDGKTIIGVVERKDLTSLAMKPSLKPEDLIDLSAPGYLRSTIDLPSQNLIGDVLGLLMRNSCAVVNDDNGKGIGIIAMQAVVNEILGP